MENVLVLNSAYQPVSIISWMDAITLFFKEKVDIVSSYENELHSPSMTIKMPSIVRLKNFIRPHRNITIYKPFTRRNIYIRDKGICQYCGMTVSFSQFTIDHVTPKSLKGLSSFSNCVVSCIECNTKKGNATLQECGMKLIRKPLLPKIANSLEEYTIMRMKELKSIPHVEWKQYLNWLKNN